MVRQTNLLFNAKTIKRLCQDVAITDKQREAVKEWLKLLDENKLEDEKKNYFRFGEIILQDILGYPIKEVDFESDNVEFQFANSEGKKMLCFEAKGTSTKDLFSPQHRQKKEHETPIKQTGDYMMSIGLDYGICTNYKDFVLITKEIGYSKYHKFDFESIKNDEEKLKEFIGIFSKERLIDKGFTKKLYHESIIEEREFTKEFYKLFHETRLMLIKTFQEHPDVTKEEAIHYAQLYLNRIIFMFFSEDNGLIYNRLFSTRIQEALKSPLISEYSKSISDEILNLFSALNKGSNILGIYGFNGGLFYETIPPKIYFTDLQDSKSFSDIRQNSELSKNLKLDDFSAKMIKKYSGQLNPIITNFLIMDSFDFTSEINVNILGHIFEQSISDLEELLGEGTSRRKKEGVYYTPEYITDYICRNTIIPYLSKNNSTTVSELVKEYAGNVEELERRLKEIKILDPACGSGAFLVKAVDILLEIDEEVQNRKHRASDFQITEFSEEREITKIIQDNIFGVDINEESVEIAKLSLFLRLASTNRKLIDLSQNIKVGNSLIDDPNLARQKAFVWEKEFSHIVGKNNFDVIIGNPPYGAELNKNEQKYLSEKYSIGSTDTAQLMMELAFKLLSKNGINGFIVPKAFTFASNWKKIRSLLIDNLSILMDVGKVWKEVKLEQVIYVLRKNVNNAFYMSGRRDGQILQTGIKIDKKDCELFEFLINGITDEELVLGKKIYLKSEKLEKYIENRRGCMLQNKVKDMGEIKVFGGAQIQRYQTIGLKGYMDRKDIDDDKAHVQKESILAQRIVAHIENPIDHIKITAAIPKTTDFIILDTINQIKVKAGASPYFVLGLLNSKIVNWYSYRFIFAKAIRTMQFDNPTTDRIPIIIKKQDQIEKRVKDLLKIYELHHDAKSKFLDNVTRTFKINKFNEKFEEFHKLDFNKFMVEVGKLSEVKISLKEQDEWSDYFNDQKKKTLEFETTIKESESEINKIFYEIFELSDTEINMVEKSTSE